ncbi:hypothetical protein NDU88_002364 [Pleurodeles waltl]|uniref:Uncharacterized protein n=1 Tax=Pleurodeles waltl TaxID=8319 RepID=A0AAV7QCP2_PLEWA|nr:hypothetical protein NDU88_002364 [Pleurodeles waltl]
MVGAGPTARGTGRLLLNQPSDLGQRAALEQVGPGPVHRRCRRPAGDSTGAVTGEAAEQRGVPPSSSGDWWRSWTRHSVPGERQPLGRRDLEPMDCWGGWPLEVPTDARNKERLRGEVPRHVERRLVVVGPFAVSEVTRGRIFEKA